MQRRIVIASSILLCTLVLAFWLASRGPATSPACRVAIVVDNVKVLISPLPPDPFAKFGDAFFEATLCVTNAGTRAVKVQPIYSVEKEPADANPFRAEIPLAPRGNWSGTWKPGEGRTVSIAFRAASDRAWRIGLWCEDVHPGWREYIREWSIRTGLRERRGTTILQYSDWFYPTSGPTNRRDFLRAKAGRDPGDDPAAWWRESPAKK